MKYNVRLVESASEDLFDIYSYVFENDSEANAERLYAKLYGKCTALQKLPERGHIPPELADVSISDFLEITLKPYRIIYRIIDNDVIVHCILDGRRDMQTLFMERLLRQPGGAE